MERPDPSVDRGTHPFGLRPPPLARTVRLVENTLREGVETPGVRFTVDDKVRVAKQLDKLGVDFIEAGSPGQSAEERDSVRAVTAAGLKAKVSAIGRVFQPDYNEHPDVPRLADRWGASVLLGRGTWTAHLPGADRRRTEVQFAQA